MPKVKEQLKNTELGQNAARRAGEREARDRERQQTAPDAERRGRPGQSTRDGGAAGNVIARMVAEHPNKTVGIRAVQNKNANKKGSKSHGWEQ